MCVQSVELAVSSLAAISDGGFFGGGADKAWFPGGNVLLWLESPGYDARFAFQVEAKVGMDG